MDLLLRNGASCREEVRMLIRKNIPDFDPARLTSARNDRPVKSILFNLIERDDLAGLQRYTAGRASMDWDANNGQFTLLQFACDLGRADIAGELVDRGAQPGLTAANSRPPLVLAAHRGYHAVIQAVTERLGEPELGAVLLLADREHGQRSLLHEVVRRPGDQLQCEVSQQSSYSECLKLLLEPPLATHTQRIINFRDFHGETALHYATQQPDQELIKLLLHHGANMGVKNKDGKAAVSRIRPDTLEEFFNSCLQPDGLITDDDFKLTFDYKFLAPPLLDAEVLLEWEAGRTKEVEAGVDLRTARPETEALWYMSESKQHRGLLKHPLVSSFLWMKWQRIRSFYYLGVASYFLFVLLLTSLVILDYGGCSLQPDSGRVNTTGLKLVIGIFIIFLVLLEFVQIGVSFKRYVASPENLMQNSILLISTILILLPDYYCSCQGEVTAEEMRCSETDRVQWENKRHLAALLIVLSWMECLIYVGLHPSLNTKVFMFYSVVATFFKFLLWYVFLVIAFALSFYIMFHTDHADGEANPDYPFFDQIGSCLTKSIAMFVGELEFSDIPFTANAISSILFIAFIFLIVVVLMNLLNGLAVSDIGIIRDEAEVLSLKSQVDLISYWESILLNDPYNFLTSWPKFLAALPSFSCCSALKRLPGCETFLSKITGGTRILLFYECLPLKSATFSPNKRMFSCNPYKKRVKVEPASQGRHVTGLEVRKDILEIAKSLILAKQLDEKDNDENSEVLRKIQGLEQQLSLVMGKLELLTKQ